MSDRFGAAWRDYHAKVIPPTAGEVQIQETRRAFYAGATALLMLLMKQLEPGSEPTAKDLAMMDALEQELLTFALDLKTGRA